MPALARVGLVLLALGLVADVAYHSVPTLTASLFGSDGVRAHLVVFVGMLAVVSGLIQQGLTAGRSTSIYRKA